VCCTVPNLSQLQTPYRREDLAPTQLLETPIDPGRPAVTWHLTDDTRERMGKKKEKYSKNTRRGNLRDSHLIRCECQFTEEEGDMVSIRFVDSPSYHGLMPYSDTMRHL
jgi:hypothetical protein